VVSVVTRYPMLIAIGLVFVLLSTAMASAQAPPGPVARYTTRFEGVTPPASQFEIVQQVLEAAPGAASAFHSRGGPAFFTVIEGEMTFREIGKAGVVLKAGATFRALPTQVFDISAPGPARARLVATTLLPSGAALITFQPGSIAPPLGPRLLGITRSQVTAPAATFDVVQIVLDFAPGVFTAIHSHSGPGQVTVFEGTLVSRRGTTDTTYPAGQGWLEAPVVAHSAGNLSNAPGSLAVTFLHPPGVPLTTVVGAPTVAPGPPNTGTGLVAERTPWQLPVGGVLVIIALLGTAVIIRPRARR